MGTLLTNYESIESNATFIFEKIDSIKSSKNNVKDKSQRITALEENLDEIYTKIDSSKETIDNLKSSDEYTKLLETKQKIDSMSIDQHKIKTEIDTQFTKISRPLSKYNFISALDKPLKVLMGKLLDNPFDVLSSNNKNDIITIFDSVRNEVRSGSVSVKDIEKSIRQIDETVGTIDGFIEKIQEFTSKKDQLTQELTIFNMDELEQNESNLKKLYADKEDVESKINTNKNAIAEIKDRIPHTIVDIETKLREISSTRYHIKYNFDQD